MVGGGRIETQDDRMAVILQGRPVNHILHLILTIVTLGIWGLVWLALVIFRGQKRQMITVDEYGQEVVSFV